MDFVRSSRHSLTDISFTIVWESVDAVNAAHNSPEGAKFRADIEAVTDTSNPELKIHINTFVFTNDYAPVADAAITEQTFMFVDPSVNQADFVAVWEEALKGWTSPPGWITGTYGWAEGEVDNPPQLGAGKSKVFLASAGWESLDKAKAGISVSKTAFEPLVTKFGLKPEQVHSRFTVLTKAP